MIGLDVSVIDNSDQEGLSTLDRMPTGWLETVGTVFDLANENAPYKSLKRAIKRSFADYREDEIIPMAQLNEQYAPLGLFFKEDHKRGYVDLVVNKKLDDIKKQDIISRGPNNSFAQASYFIAGLGGSFTDVINIGTSVIPIVGQARFLQMVGKYGKTSARLRRGAIEGGVGNTLFEPVEFAMAKAEQRDYGFMDSLYNISFGAVLGSGLNFGMGKIGDVYKKYTGKDNIYNDIENAPIELKEDLIKYSIGRVLQGKRINATEFLEQTKIERDRQLRIKHISEATLKSNLGNIVDVGIPSRRKNIKSIKQFTEKLQQQIESNLPKAQKLELQKLKKQYDVLEKKLQKKKYKKVVESKEEIDLELINKNKTLIPYIAKLNSLNKKIKILEDRGQEAAIKNSIEQRQFARQRGTDVSYNTLTKIEQLRTMYSNPDRFEIKNGEMVNRANKLNLNPESNVELALQVNKERLDSQGKLSDVNNIDYRNFTDDNLEIETKFDLTKQIDIDDVKSLQSDIDDLTNEFSGLEVLAKERFPVMNDYLNSFNASIKEIDNSLDKQDDIFKGIKVGLSCLTRKG